MYETLEVLKHLPADIVREEFLIPQVQKLKGKSTKSHRCSGLMSLRRTWRENTGQQQEIHFLY